MKLGCGRVLNRHGQCEAWTVKSLLADNAERFGRTGNNTRRILNETFRFWLQGTKCPSQDNFNSLLDSLKPQLDQEPLRTAQRQAFTELVAAYDDWKNLRERPRPQPAQTAAHAAPAAAAGMAQPRLAAWSLSEHFQRAVQTHAFFCGRHRILEKIASWYDEENSKYVEGAAAPAQPMLLVTGDPGIGKSALLAHVIRIVPRGFVVCGQFCDHTVAETLKPGRFVLHLASALETNENLREYHDRLCDTTAGLSDESIKTYVEDSEEDPRALFNRFFIGPLKDVRPADIGWIIIDALDEALEIGGRPGPVPTIVHLLARELDTLPPWVRVLATCRRDVPELLGAAGEPGGRIRLLPLADYWEDRDARDYIAKRRADSQEKHLPEKTAGQLIANSGGNFLLLKLLLDRFYKTANGDGFDAIPSDLAAFYAQDFERRFPPRTEERRRFETDIQPLLAVAMANDEPSMSADFLRRVTGLEQRRLVLALRDMRDYFPLRLGGHAVFHKSFFDWLSGPLAGEYYVDAGAGHKKLAAFCAGVLGRLIREWPVRIESSDDARSYALKNGITHLVRAGFFAEAIYVLDFIVQKVIPRAEHLLPPATASRLRSPAVATRTLLLAVDDSDNDTDPFAFTLADAAGAGELPVPSASGDRQNVWQPLCRLLKLFYQVEPLHDVISKIFRRCYPDEWPSILEDLLGSENYVLTHEIAMVLGDALSAAKIPISAIGEYLNDVRDVNRFELGGYTLRRFLGREPDRIDECRQYLRSLADCPVYVGPTILGEIVLNQTLQDWRFAAEIRGPLFCKFWHRKPMWDHIRQGIWDIEAAALWGAGKQAPKAADCGLKAAYDHLTATERLRCRLAQDGLVTRHAAIAALVENRTYWSLGNHPDPISDARGELGDLPVSLMSRVFRLLFAHPVWEVGETAASVLASITVELPSALEILQELLDRSGSQDWRVRFGAIETAYCRPHFDPEARDDLFYRSVGAFFDDPHSGIRALCAENLVSLIIEQAAASRQLLLERFHDEILYWFNQEQDCWVLEHLFRLRKTFETGYDWETLFPLRPTSLFAGLPHWSDRQNFLDHIEHARLHAT